MKQEDGGAVPSPQVQRVSVPFSPCEMAWNVLSRGRRAGLPLRDALVPRGVFSVGSSCTSFCPRGVRGLGVLRPRFWCLAGAVWVGLLPEEGSSSAHGRCSAQLVTVAGPCRPVCLGHREARCQRGPSLCSRPLRGPVGWSLVPHRASRGSPLRCPATAPLCRLCERGPRAPWTCHRAGGALVCTSAGTVPDSVCGGSGAACWAALACLSGAGGETSVEDWKSA